MQMVLFETESKWSVPTVFPKLSQYGVIAIDIETRDDHLTESGPGVRSGGYIVGIAVGIPNVGNYYYPMRHAGGGNLNVDIVIEYFRSNLLDYGGLIVGANLMYDLDYLYHAGIRCDNAKFWDVLIAEPLLNMGVHSLDSVSKKYLRKGKNEGLLQEAARNYGIKPKSELWKLDAKYVGAYAEADVELPLAIYRNQKYSLAKENTSAVMDLEMSLIPVLLAMRQRGVRVDLQAAEKENTKLIGRYNEITQYLYSLTGQRVSVWKVKSFAHILKAQGLDLGVTEHTGKYSITQEWLEEHDDNEIARLILEGRKVHKIFNTFVRGYILDKSVLGRIHPLFHQLKGEFGGTPARFSSSHPNLQNIPKRDKVYGPMMRSLFLPDEGEVYERLDWSQIEYRFLAHYAIGTGAEQVRARYNTDPSTDYHSVCAELAGIPDRSKVKNVNFGVVYGAGVGTTAATMGVSETEASAFLRMYDEKLPFVRNTFNIAMSRAKQVGEIKTIYGRKRKFPDPNFCYKALNALLQDSAADLMKVAMRDIWLSGVCNVLGAPLLTVHDELCFSRPQTQEGAEALAEVHHIMENCITLKVPIRAVRESGINWGDCKS